VFGGSKLDMYDRVVRVIVSCRIYKSIPCMFGEISVHKKYGEHVTLEISICNNFCNYWFVLIILLDSINVKRK